MRHVYEFLHKTNSCLAFGLSQLCSLCSLCQWLIVPDVSAQCGGLLFKNRNVQFFTGNFEIKVKEKSRILQKQKKPDENLHSFCDLLRKIISGH
jgi:hypothetical protein